jgi:ubiquinone/menaquinone biosynthesis C-methylase UbiE
MYDDGYHNMENIDISKVVIDQMRDKYKDRASGGMSFKVMNACHLDYPDEHFDCVLDKGTLDSILCGEGSTGNVAKMLSEVVRVLKPNGVFFMVSYGVSDNRLGYLVSDEYPWKVSVTSVAKPTVSANAVSDSKDANSVHYIYVAVKDAGAEK